MFVFISASNDVRVWPFAIVLLIAITLFVLLIAASLVKLVQLVEINESTHSFIVGPRQRDGARHAAAAGV